MSAKEPLAPMRVCEPTGHKMETTFYERRGRRMRKVQCLFCNHTRISELHKEASR